MHYLGTDKTVKHKASLKTGKRITIHKVEHYEVLDTSFWPINIEKDTLKKQKQKTNKKPPKYIKFDIFKCCTASTAAPGITLAPDSVFSRSAWHIRVCRPTNLCSGKTPFSVLISKGTAFTYSTVNIKEVQVVCHWAIEEYSNKRTIIKPWLKTVAFKTKHVSYVPK